MATTKSTATAATTQVTTATPEVTINESASLDALIEQLSEQAQEGAVGENIYVAADTGTGESVIPDDMDTSHVFVLDTTLSPKSVAYGQKIQEAIANGEVANRPYIHDVDFLKAFGLDVTKKMSLVTLTRAGFADIHRVRNENDFSYVSNLAYLIS